MDILLQVGIIFFLLRLCNACFMTSWERIAWHLLYICSRCCFVLCERYKNQWGAWNTIMSLWQTRGSQCRGKEVIAEHCPQLITSYRGLTNSPLGKILTAFLVQVTFLLFVLWWLLVELSDINNSNLEIICFTWTLNKEILFHFRYLWECGCCIGCFHFHFIGFDLILKLLALIYFNHASKMHLNRFNLPWK